MPHVADAFALLVVAIRIVARLFAFDATLRVHEIRLEAETCDIVVVEAKLHRTKKNTKNSYYLSKCKRCA
jgi:hypothetical protein